MEFQELQKVLPKPIRCWTVSDVRLWLQSINMTNLYPRFKSLSIDGSCLPLLDQIDLQNELNLRSSLSISKIMNWVDHKFVQYDRFLQQKLQPKKHTVSMFNSQHKHSRESQIVDQKNWSKNKKMLFDPDHNQQNLESGQKLTQNRGKFRQSHYETKNCIMQQLQMRILEDSNLFRKIQFERERRKKKKQMFCRMNSPTQGNSSRWQHRSDISQEELGHKQMTICDPVRKKYHKVYRFPFGIGNKSEAHLQLQNKEEEHLIVIKKDIKGVHYVEKFVGNSYISHNINVPIVIDYHQSNQQNVFKIGQITYYAEFIHTYNQNIVQDVCLILICERQWEKSKILVNQPDYKLRGKPTSAWYWRENINDYHHLKNPIVATIIKDKRSLGKFYVHPHLDQVWRPIIENKEYRVDFGTQFLLGHQILEIGIEDRRLLFDEQDCVICYGRPRQSVLLDCGHNVCCMRCAWNLQVCPICRSHIVDVARAYKF